MAWWDSKVCPLRGVARWDGKAWPSGDGVGWGSMTLGGREVRGDP